MVKKKSKVKTNENESPDKGKKESPDKGKKESPEKSKKESPEKSKKDKNSPNKKSSPKKEKGSPDKKNSPKKGKKEVEEPAVPQIERLHKLTSTYEDFAPFIFQQFRCSRCTLVFPTVQKFINHFCWDKFFKNGFHLGNTQVYCCRTCDRLYNDQTDYSTHVCREPDTEDVLPISYRRHFKFYISWERRIKKESEFPHDTDWIHLCKCLKCGNRYKNVISYLLHSCYLYSLIKPEITKELCLCHVCKYVMLDEEQFEAHVGYCPKPDKAYIMSFETNFFHRVCHQFVIGRHCYEHNLYRKNYYNLAEEIRLQCIPVGCFDCGLLQDSVAEFLYHPCVAGKVITPTDLELTLICNTCRCFFITIDHCIEHMRSCTVETLTFVRLNLSELKLALKRWTVDIHANTLLPDRPEKLMCNKCLEIFRHLMDLIIHMCPRRPAHVPCFMQPIGLQELYCCEACFMVLFSSLEAVAHTENCTLQSKTLMIQIHPTLDECLVSLRSWTKLPRLLQLEMSIGLPMVKDDIY